MAADWGDREQPDLYGISWIEGEGASGAEGAFEALQEKFPDHEPELDR